MAVNSIVGKDDMSNIDPNPPAVQWAYQHSVEQVALYEWIDSAWQPICSIPAEGTPGPTQLSGVWLSPDQAIPSQVQMQLKVFPYTMLPGPTLSATWAASSGQQVYGSSFTDQGLQFNLDNGLSPAQITAVEGHAITRAWHDGTRYVTGEYTYPVSHRGAAQRDHEPCLCPRRRRALFR